MDEPAELEESLRRRRRQAAGEMRPPLGPVETRPREDAPRRSGRSDVHAESVEPGDTSRRDVIAAACRAQPPRRHLGVEQRHAGSTGEVVVAGAGELQRGSGRRLAKRAGPPCRGNVGQRLEGLGHLRPSQPVVAMTALAHGRDKATVEQPLQVFTRRRTPDAGNPGQLPCRQGPPGQQGVEHCRPARVADQGGGNRQVGIAHALTLWRGPFGSDRSVPFLQCRHRRTAKQRLRRLARTVALGLRAAGPAEWDRPAARTGRCARSSSTSPRACGMPSKSAISATPRAVR